MLRRNARLRREYLFKKSADNKERVTAERKRRVKEAIESGNPIPYELRANADQLRAQIELDDASGRGPPENDLDSEYVNAGVDDPKVGGLVGVFRA